MTYLQKIFTKKELLTLPKLMSIFFMLFGLYLLLNNLVGRFFWEKTEGVIAELIERPDGGSYNPVVEFETVQGEKVRVKIKQAAKHYELGERIAIMYAPEDYRQAKIDSVFWIYGFPGIFMLVGLIAFLIPSEAFYVS